MAKGTHIGNNTPISIIDLVNLIGKVMDIEPDIKFCDYQVGDVPKTYANIDKAKEKLGYSPKTDMENGLRKFYSWMQNEE
jgi:UDP-glucuronate 4-epimerase